PNVTVAIDVDAVRPREHAAAEAFDLLPRFVEVMNRVRLRAETAGRRSGRAAIGGPHRLAIPIDRDAVRAAPLTVLERELRPVANHAIRVRAAIDGSHRVGLRRASPLLALNETGLQCDE